MLLRILLLTCLACAALAAFLLGDPWLLTATLPVLGLVSLSGRTILLVATVVFVAVGAMEEDAAEASILPGLLTAGTFLAARLLPAGVPAWAPLPFLGVLLPLVLAAQVVWQQGRGLAGWWAAAVLMFAAYVSGFFVFVGVWEAHVGGLVTVPAVGTAGGLLAFRLFQLGPPPRSPLRSDPPHQDDAGKCPVEVEAAQAAAPSSLALPAMATGLCLAELAWALLYWPVSGLIAGGLLLAAFYAIGGVLGAAVGERLRPGLVVEYGLVGLLAIALVIAAVVGAH